MRVAAVLLVLGLAGLALGQDNCHCDIAIVLDASGSVWPTDWVKEKGFATTIVNDLQKGGHLGSGMKDSRVSLLAFSNSATLYQPLTGSQGILNSKIASMVKTEGSTDTAAAISAAAAALNAGSRSCKTLKLVTDGMSNIPSATLAAAKAAKAQNITVVGIGVGPLANMTEIRALVSPPINKNAIRLASFSGLAQLAHSMFDNCATPAPPALNNTQSCTCDVMLVLDGSGSIASSDFARIKSYAFVYAHAYRARMMSRQVRMGAIVYSSIPRLVSAPTYSYYALRGALRSMTQPRGSTNTAAALLLAQTELWRSQPVNLTCTTIKVVTDGRSNNPSATINMAYQLKRKFQITVQVVGVGRYLYKRELVAMASRPLSANLFLLKNFMNLTALAHKLADKCDPGMNATTATPMPVNDCYCDLILVLDSSGSISNSEWAQVQAFARGMVNLLKPHLGAGINGVEITIIEYSTKARIVVKNAYNYNQLIGAIATMRSMRGLTYTWNALNLARYVLYHNARGNSKCQAVKVLTDGVSQNPGATARAAHILKKTTGARVMAIGVGNGVRNSELKYIASPPLSKNVLKITQWSQLAGLANKLVKKCNKTATPTPNIPAATPPPPKTNDCNCDIALVLDASGSITPRQWVSITNFARIIVRDLSPVLGATKARIALVRYSYSVWTISYLSWDASALQRAINRMRQTRGITRTDLGIGRATYLLLRARNARRKGCKTIKLVTDGRSTVRKLTWRSAHRAKAYGITIMAIGVAGASKGELNMIASKPLSKNSLYLSNFNGLATIAHAIGDKCNSKGTKTVAPNPNRYNTCHCDYALVLDASGSIGATNFKNVLDFASTITYGLSPSMSSTDTRVGVITYSVPANIRIKLSGSYSSVSAAIKRIPIYTAGGTNTPLALSTAGNMLRMYSRGLGRCKRIILLTDGKSCCCSTSRSTSCRTKSIRTAHILKARYRIQILVYAVGANVDPIELNNVASRMPNSRTPWVRRLPKFSGLHAAAAALVQKCNKNMAPTPYAKSCQCDIVLVLDGSGSVSSSGWAATKQFCTTFASALRGQLAKGSARIGIVIFASRPSVWQGLTSNLSTLTGKCTSMRQPRGGTLTNKALWTAGTMLRRGGKSCKAIKLLTDGRSNNPRATDKIAERLKRRYGIKIVGIGVGRGVNMNEIRDVASSPASTNAIHISSYRSAIQVAKTITKRCGNPVYTTSSVCKYTSVVRCTIRSRTRSACLRVTRYNSCATTYKCEDLMKIWCYNIFKKNRAYRRCSSTRSICAKVPSKCMVWRYNACYRKAKRYSRSRCTRQNRYIRCAEGSACRDLTTYLCSVAGRRSFRRCNLSQCGILKKNRYVRYSSSTYVVREEEDDVDMTALDEMFVVPDEEGFLGGFPVVVVGIAGLCVVLVGALVALAIKYRSRQEEDLETPLVEDVEE